MLPAKSSALQRILARAACSYSNKKLPGVIDFAQFEKCIIAKTSLILDVREPAELQKKSDIPGSFNLPLGKMVTAFSLSGEEFQKCTELRSRTRRIR
jgi:rhodanese-related sulfurtransferase